MRTEILERYYPQEQRIPREYKLFFLSLLDMAIHDLTRQADLSNFNQRYHKDMTRDYESYRRDAYVWLKSDEEMGQGCFTFIQICDYLDLDPKRIREGLGI